MENSVGKYLRKGDKCMSKKKKQSEKQPEARAWLTPEEAGIDNIWDAAFSDEAETIAREDIGYLCVGTRFQYSDSNVGGEACKHLVKWHDLYFVWSEFEYGSDGYIDATVDPMVFRSYEDAKEAYDNAEQGEPSVWKEIADCKAELGLGDDIWVNVKYDHYQVKYKYLLLMDRVYSLDADEIRKEISAFEAAAEDLAKDELTITGIWKERPWNSNTRYFHYELRDNRTYETYEYEEPIPSEYQHRTRSSLTFAKWGKYKKAILAERPKLEQEQKEKQAIIDADLQILEQRRETLHMPFPFETAQVLENYLNEHIRVIVEKDEPAIVGCDGTLRLTKAWLKEHFNNRDEEENALAYLMEHGGYCDCEVLANALREECWN